ncbi:hypothetical protein [Pseudonocardia alni]|uniref:hypothetical protein n=1 Tax=Pseudonocardia alni TaxID=33907 RepID=UPI0033F89983
MHPELRAAAADLDGTDAGSLALLRDAEPGHVFAALYRALSEPEDGDAPHPDVVDAVRRVHPDARHQIGVALHRWSRPGQPPHRRPVRGAYSPRLWAGLAAEYAAARVLVELDQPPAG